jgi:glycosyltransferase involved in cell wall biosynthesis
MSKSQQMISVLLTTYNGSMFLREQMDSILNQTHSEIEIIAVDDGSSDNTVDLLREYRRSDSRIKLLLGDSCRGQKFRLAQAFESSTSAVLAISDQDDIWHNRKLEFLLDGLGQSMMAFGPSQLIDASGNELGCTILDAIGIEPRPQDRLSALFRPLVSAHALIVRREGFSMPALHRQTHPFDRLMGLEALYSSGVTYVEQAVVYHRIHQTNQCNRDVLDKGSNDTRWFQPWKVRRALMQTAQNRIGFLFLLDYLASSFIISSAARATFQKVLIECQNAWQKWWRPVLGGFRRGQALKDKVVHQMSSFSGNSSDLDFFVEQFRNLLYLPPHPICVGAALLDGLNWRQGTRDSRKSG